MLMLWSQRSLNIQMTHMQIPYSNKRKINYEIKIQWNFIKKNSPFRDESFSTPAPSANYT